MAGVEDVVRQSLRAQLRYQPPLHDPAGRAIAGARTARNRRVVTGALGGAAVLILLVGGVGQLRGDLTRPDPPVGSATPTVGGASPTVDPSGTAAPAPTGSAPGPAVTAGMSMISGGRTLLGSFGSVSLDRIAGGASGGYATRDGLLIQGSGTGDAGLSLWLFRPGNRDLVPLVTDATSEVMVAPDGRRLAWRAGGELRTGHRTDAGTLVVEHRTPAPERGWPIFYTGSALYLGASRTGGGIDMHDVWLPDRGRYVPTWDNPNQVVAVYGVLGPDQPYLLGLIRGGGAGGKDTCLAELDPAAELRPVRTACGVVDALPGGVSISPDGHWLVLPDAGSSGGAGLRSPFTAIDLTTVFDRPVVTATWQLTAPPAWQGTDAFAMPDGSGGFLRLRVGADGRIIEERPVTVPGLSPGGAATGETSWLRPIG